MEVTLKTLLKPVRAISKSSRENVMGKRENGFYWVKSKDHRCFDSIIAEWSDGFWYIVDSEQLFTGNEYWCLSQKLDPPTDWFDKLCDE